MYMYYMHSYNRKVYNFDLEIWTNDSFLLLIMMMLTAVSFDVNISGAC